MIKFIPMNLLGVKTQSTSWSTHIFAFLVSTSFDSKLQTEIWDHRTPDCYHTFIV